jgi:hypothetical protein
MLKSNIATLFCNIHPSLVGRLHTRPVRCLTLLSYRSHLPLHFSMRSSMLRPRISTTQNNYGNQTHHTDTSHRSRTFEPSDPVLGSHNDTDPPSLQEIRVCICRQILPICFKQPLPEQLEGKFILRTKIHSCSKPFRCKQLAEKPRKVVCADIFPFGGVEKVPNNDQIFWGNGHQ